MRKYNILYSEHFINLQDGSKVIYQKNKSTKGEFIAYVGLEYLKKNHPPIYNNFIKFISLIEENKELEGKNKGNWQDKNLCKIIVKGTTKEEVKFKKQIDFFESHQIKHYHLGNKDGSYNEIAPKPKAKIEELNKDGKNGSSIVHYTILEKNNTKSIAILGLSIDHPTGNFPQPFDEHGNTLYWHLIFGE